MFVPFVFLFTHSLWQGRQLRAAGTWARTAKGLYHRLIISESASADLFRDGTSLITFGTRPGKAENRKQKTESRNAGAGAGASAPALRRMRSRNGVGPNGREGEGIPTARGPTQGALSASQGPPLPFGAPQPQTPAGCPVCRSAPEPDRAFFAFHRRGIKFGPIPRRLGASEKQRG